MEAVASQIKNSYSDLGWEEISGGLGGLPPSQRDPRGAGKWATFPVGIYESIDQDVLLLCCFVPSYHHTHQTHCNNPRYTKNAFTIPSFSRQNTEPIHGSRG